MPRLILMPAMTIHVVNINAVNLLSVVHKELIAIASPWSEIIQFLTFVLYPTVPRLPIKNITVVGTADHCWDGIVIPIGDTVSDQ